MILLTAVGVAEFGNKLIKAWLSSKDCVRLGSSEIEPIKKEKNILSRSESKIS